MTPPKCLFNFHLLCLSITSTTGLSLTTYPSIRLSCTLSTNLFSFMVKPSHSTMFHSFKHHKPLPVYFQNPFPLGNIPRGDAYTRGFSSFIPALPLSTFILSSGNSNSNSHPLYSSISLKLYPSSLPSYTLIKM